MLVGAPISPALVPHKSNELPRIALLVFPSLTFPSSPLPRPPNVSPSLMHDQLRPRPPLTASQHFSPPGPLLCHSFTLCLFGCCCQIHRETGSRPKVVEKKGDCFIIIIIFKIRNVCLYRYYVVSMCPFCFSSHLQGVSTQKEEKNEKKMEKT